MRPKGFDAFESDYYEDGPFDLIVSLSPEAHHTALELLPKLAAAAEYWPTFDPSLAEGSRDQVLMEYRTVRDGLARRIAAAFPAPIDGIGPPAYKAPAAADSGERMAKEELLEFAGTVVELLPNATFR